MEFRLLGRFAVEADGVDLTPPRRQHRTLLALLLLHADEVVTTDDCVDALWGERPPETAQTALHGHVSALRKRLGAERIETHHAGYRLRLADGDEVDLRRFEHLAAEAPADGRVARSEQLSKALALFRGEPLADFRYEAFASQEADRLDQLRLAVIEERIQTELELGRHEEVVLELERLITEHPLREGLRAQLMVALYRAGRQADALEAFQDARSVLRDELGLDPSPALQRLEQQILNQDPELVAPDAFAPARHSAAATKPTGIVTFLSTDASTPPASSCERASGSTAGSTWRPTAIPCSSPLPVPGTRWPPRSVFSGRRGASPASGSASARPTRSPPTRGTRRSASAVRRASGAPRTRDRSSSRRPRATFSGKRPWTRPRWSTSGSTV